MTNHILWEPWIRLDHWILCQLHEDTERHNPYTGTCMYF